MERKTVTSSRITSIGWDDNILEIEFHNGVLYHYSDVTYQEYKKFLSSPSLGRELNYFQKLHPYYLVQY